MCVYIDYTHTYTHTCPYPYLNRGMRARDALGHIQAHADTLRIMHTPVEYKDCVKEQETTKNTN